MNDLLPPPDPQSKPSKVYNDWLDYNTVKKSVNPDS